MRKKMKKKCLQENLSQGDRRLAGSSSGSFGGNYSSMAYTGPNGVSTPTTPSK